MSKTGQKDPSLLSIAWLREQTGCRYLDCHKALKECDGDEKKALDLLRKKSPLPSWAKDKK